MVQKVFWCKNCLNMSTRPRIQFDGRGWCNACQWMEIKKTMDWQPRREELQALLDQYRSTTGGFDCIVPVSGGKDGGSIAYRLRNLYGMHPLTVTVRPALELSIGNENLLNFINEGFNHLHVSPDVQVMRKINTLGFVEKGFPYYGWLIAIFSAVIRVAVNFNIPLLFYGEDGEVEYGGSIETRSNSLFNLEYMKRVYFEAGYEKVFNKLDLTNKDLYFFTFPSEEELAGKELYFTHWSYFEAWDSYRNYLLAKEHCGLKEVECTNAGTFTNFAQNDQALYALHTYLMYLKFGFGRATQDAGIEIRRGAMTRDQAIELVRVYDNHYPEAFIDQYLEYYQMTQQEFDAALDKWANKELFNKIDGRWQPAFEVE
ncbi:MAG: N-acetyl sugar amidotransferase [Pseudomonadota bacterium]